MAERSLTLFSMPRERVRRELEQRIERAKEITPTIPQSWEDLANAEGREIDWRKYNTEFLSRAFTTTEYTYEYGEAQVRVHQARDPYYEPFLSEVTARLLETVKQEVRCLSSILERLDLIEEVAADKSKAATAKRTKVFVVHGHDDAALQATARFLERIGLEPIVLRERPDQGLTIIEKFEANASEVGFAVVLLTPDDLGAASSSDVQKTRARQNVIFELGYFVGYLGRGRACLLRKGDLEIPSDLAGVIYTDFDHPGEGWKLKLARELKAAGMQFDESKVTG